MGRLVAWSIQIAWLLERAVAPHPPMPVCPPCYTVTEHVATGACQYPACIGPTSPAANCTHTLDLRPMTTTMVMNMEVCSLTPTITKISPCPTATPCNEAACDWVTLGSMGDEDVTRYVSNCRASSTPWKQPLPPGYTSGPSPAAVPQPTTPDGPPETVTMLDLDARSPQWSPPGGADDDDDGCDDDDRETYTYGICPTYSCPRITAMCTSAAPQVTPTPITRTSIDGCTTRIEVGLNPCPTCATCTRSLMTPTPRTSPTSSTPTPRPPPTTTTGRCDDDDDRETVTARLECTTYSCFSPTATCLSALPTITPRSTTQTTIHGCTTTLRTGYAPCPTCPSCVEKPRPGTTIASHPLGTSCNAENRRTSYRGLCPTYSCILPSATCPPDMARVTRTQTTQTVVDGCWTTILRGESPCSRCPSCRMVDGSWG